MVVGRDAQRIRYQPMGSSPPETITHLEDIWGAKIQDTGTGRTECHSSRRRKRFRCSARHQVPGGLAGEETAGVMYALGQGHKAMPKELSRQVRSFACCMLSECSISPVIETGVTKLSMLALNSLRNLGRALWLSCLKPLKQLAPDLFCQAQWVVLEMCLKLTLQLRIFFNSLCI